MSMSASVAFKWLHINSLHDWLMSLAMNLAALCDVEVKMAPMDAVWWVLVKT